VLADYYEEGKVVARLLLTKKSTDFRRKNSRKRGV